ncbi:MAG: nucleoside triphosphate pyrophosphohydrolase [Anaerolineaceae bacterium]|nr:nucleoside triphosphate pyrophosphohydrolase [Anaerolineaceae bacterium]
MRIEYNKLIRDRIPEIIARSGKTCVVVPLSPEEYTLALADKLVEEAGEARAAGGQHLLTELADLAEVLDALLDLHGWSQEDLRRVQAERRQARGAFDQRLKLLSVTGPSG